VVGHPDERFLPILKRYSEGKVSAYDAACEIPKPNVPGFDDPGASEVIVGRGWRGTAFPRRPAKRRGARPRRSCRSGNELGVITRR
jgi:hypothetical protein